MLRFTIFICISVISYCQKQCVDLNTLRKDAMTATNTYRAKHGAPALVESASLNDIAQKYSETLLATGKFTHSQNNYGENLYYSMGMTIVGKLPIDSWYNEVKYYNFEKGTSNGGTTGHFTQLVWLGSKQVGHGFAISSDCKTVYVVANYDPPGNYIGQYTQNVKPEGTSQPSTDTVNNSTSTPNLILPPSNSLSGSLHRFYQIILLIGLLIF